MDNKVIWLKCFSWVERVGNRCTIFERISWMKVMGIPLFTWDESNIDTIVGSFGKVLVNFSPFQDSKDISHGNICVLTASRKKLNEEVMVSLDGTLHKIGLFKVDDDYVPFKQFNTGSTCELDEEYGEEDGVSGTWHQDELDLGKGEIGHDGEFDDGFQDR